MSKVTIKTLRYYEKEGLLIPKYVDTFNGYRYYENSQLLDLGRIISLKQVGLSIEDIKKVIIKKDSLDNILKNKKLELENTINTYNNQLSKLNYLLEEKNMKKKVLIIIGVVIVILFGVGLITSYKDSARVRAGIEPKYVIKKVSYHEDKVTYWGLGYKVIRYVNASPNEPFKNNRGVKYGNWFMKYEKPQVEENNEEDVSNVVMTIKNGTLSKNSVTVILKNNTDKDYTYGPDFYVEKYDNGKWIQPSTITGDPLVWNSIGYILKSNDSIELNFNFKLAYGELSNGKYRIIKRVFKEEDIPITEDKIVKISVEFEIK